LESKVSKRPYTDTINKKGFIKIKLLWLIQGLGITTTPVGAYGQRCAGQLSAGLLTAAARFAAPAASEATYATFIPTMTRKKTCEAPSTCRSTTTITTNSHHSQAITKEYDSPPSSPPIPRAAKTRHLTKPKLKAASIMIHLPLTILHREQSALCQNCSPTSS